MPKLDSRSLLLLTQGNIYNRLRFLKKYLVFLAELNQPFRENWSKFLTAGYNWVPGCRVSVFFPVSSHQLYPGGRGRLARYLGVNTPSSPFISFFIFCFLIQGNDDFSTTTFEKTNWFELSRALYLTHCPATDKGPVIICCRGGGGRHAEDFGGDQS